MDAIFERISVRIFDSREVEPDKIESILRAGMAAPSGGNQRPWEFYVVKDAETITKLAGSSPYAVCAGGAGVVIVPCYRTGGLMYPELVHMDMSACVENMLIETQSLGLGSVWLSIAPYEDRMKNVEKILKIGTDLLPFALLPVGYPGRKCPEQDRFDVDRVHGI